MDPKMVLLIVLAALAIGALVGYLYALTRRDDARDLWDARAADQGAIKEGLARLHDHLRDIDQERASWQGQFRQQVDDMVRSTDLLRRETGSLATALRRPQVRGRWGELHLRKAVELAGLVQRCDFEEQVRLDDGSMRPDLVVRLAGGRSVVVDAKVPLDAFLDATGADDEEEQLAHLRRHARQLKAHTDALGSKAYWRGLDDTPEFVVLFVPGESFLSAALEADPALLEHAAGKQVVLATPTTLIALLRTVAMGWQQVRLAERTKEVQTLGAQLHERLAGLGGHLDKLGRSLAASVTAYNRAIGSLESRVLVSARQFSELGVTDSTLSAPASVAETTRELSAAELLEVVAEPRDPLPELTSGAPGAVETDVTKSAWRA